jgi:two-component system sensor histidine kinase KdpD
MPARGSWRPSPPTELDQDRVTPLVGVEAQLDPFVAEHLAHRRTLEATLVRSPSLSALHALVRRLTRASASNVSATLARVACGLAVVIATTVGLALSGADLPVALLFLLLAVVVASVLGYFPAVVSAVVGVGLLSYYFTPPLHSFAVDRADDLVALVAFVAVAAIVAAVVARLNNLRLRSELAAREARLRLALTNRLLSGAETSSVMEAAAQGLAELFDLASCDIAAGGARVAVGTERVAVGSLDVEIGSLHLRLGLSRTLDAAEVGTVEALAASLTVALERMRLDAEASESRVRGELDRSRAGFLTAVTHDLRTPLATIKAAMAALLVPVPPLENVERRELLEAAYEESARLERLVAKVLALTRIRAGGLQPDRVAINAADAARVAVARLDRLVQNRCVCVEVDADLPALWADPVMVEQVFVNLLENALRQGPSDTEIAVRAAQAADDIEVRIVDHGPGIPPADRTRAFDEFVRLSPGRDDGGTGLGLAIVRALVEVNAGRVWYEETPGGGATFAVALPVAPTDEPA